MIPCDVSPVAMFFPESPKHARWVGGVRYLGQSPKKNPFFGGFSHISPRLIWLSEAPLPHVRLERGPSQNWLRQKKIRIKF